MIMILFFAVLGLSILGCIYFYMSVSYYEEPGGNSPKSYFCDS
jgi:hypothetical protein